MDIIKKHLPAFCYSSRKMKSIDGAVIHFMSAKNILPGDPFNLDEILGIFKKYRVSANYLIRRDATVIELIPEGYRAHHAGYSTMNDRDGCNDFTIGIEIEGGTDFPYNDDQIFKLAELLGQSMTEHKYSLDWVQGHDRVRKDWNTKHPEKQKTVKVDPGPHFPWEVLRDMLYGVDLQILHEQTLG